MSLQERPKDQSVGPKRGEMADRGDALTYIPQREEDEEQQRRRDAAKYVRRWAVKHGVKDWQVVLDALDLV